VKHSLIYKSFDCNTKLNHLISISSKVGSKLSCGRTKTEALMTNVLDPSRIRDILETIDCLFSLGQT
jgi:hypothetical protein